MQQRLLVFCSDVELDLDVLRRAVRALRSGRPDLGALELAEVEPSAGILQAGFTAVILRPARGRRSAVGALEPHLDAFVEAFATALGESVLGVYHDATRAFARAAYQKGATHERAEGDAARVIRQAALWAQCPPAELARFFNATTAGSEAAPSAAPEVDEDDLFVEAKLEQARRWMEQYRARRK